MQQTQTILNRLDSFITETNKTNKTNKKLEVIGKYPDLKEIFKYVNDSQITFGITSKNFKKYVQSKKNKPFKNFISLYKLLDALKNREITGDTAAASLKEFILQFPQHKENILRVVDKNLKTRTNTKAINKVFPGLIKVFEVALAQKYQEKRIDKKTNYYLSRKLDGVRCICYYEDYGKKITFYSRAGNKFVDKHGTCSLTELFEPLRQVFQGLESVILDGEICIVNDNGIEEFQSIMKQIKKHVFNPRYYIFDILKRKEFESGKSIETFAKRYRRLQSFQDEHEAIKILPQYIMTKENFTRMKEHAAKKSWEGLMIRKDARYKSDRSYDLMKYKQFFDEEFKVKQIITGPIRITSKKTGLEETITAMTAVIIDFYNTQVGSGFSLDDRINFYKHPEKIIGKKITVQYFEKTTNQDNNDLSLRFPTYKGIRDYE